jgi:tetratricopeptide (TPR) repeat protein
LYKELEDLLEVDQMALDTVPIEDQTNDMPSSITSYKGQLYVRTGKAIQGMEILKKSYDIRAGFIPEDIRETAWALENAGNGIATANALDEAITWLERSIATWLRWDETEGPEKGVYPAVLKKSYGMILVWAGHYEKARKLLEEGVQQIESTTPYNWAMAA